MDHASGEQRALWPRCKTDGVSTWNTVLLHNLSKARKHIALTPQKSSVLGEHNVPLSSVILSHLVYLNDDAGGFPSRMFDLYIEPLPKLIPRQMFEVQDA